MNKIFKFTIWDAIAFLVVVVIFESVFTVLYSNGCDKAISGVVGMVTTIVLFKAYYVIKAKRRKDKM